MLKEFKEFALRGNLVDMAIAFVMGTAFSKIVTAFVDGMVMPLVGLLTSGKDFNKIVWTVKKESTIDEIQPDGTIVQKVVDAVTVKTGAFITVAIDFIIVAFVMFLVVKGINRMKKAKEEAPAAPPAPTKEEVLLAEIRDLLKK